MRHDLNSKGSSVGAWGHGSFENDDAADFIGDLVGETDLALASQALAVVLAAADYLEAPQASQAIAAAEVISAAAGRPTPAAQGDEELAEWLARVNPGADPALVQQAVQALDRITGEDSELRELWEESHHLEAWQAAMAALRARLLG